MTKKNRKDKHQNDGIRVDAIIRMNGVIVRKLKDIPSSQYEEKYREVMRKFM